jgi:hypothetical protein
VFVLSFAVLFGVWSPITSKSAPHDQLVSNEVALVPSNVYQSGSKPSIETHDTGVHGNPAMANYKSRVLLSVNEQDQHQHGPHLPSSLAYRSSPRTQTAAPAYTFSKAVETYMNKKTSTISPLPDDDGTSVGVADDENPAKKRRKHYPLHEQVVIIEETQENTNKNGLNDSKPVKIIRVERATPNVGNDTQTFVRRVANN